MRRHPSTRPPPRRAAVSWAIRWQRERDEQDDALKQRMAKPDRPQCIIGTQISGKLDEV